jgi:TPR repeat protein
MPCEILQHIFSFLPIQSLLQIKQVDSKLQGIVTDPVFIERLLKPLGGKLLVAEKFFLDVRGATPEDREATFLRLLGYGRKIKELEREWKLREAMDVGLMALKQPALSSSIMISLLIQPVVKKMREEIGVQGNFSLISSGFSCGFSLSPADPKEKEKLDDMEKRLKNVERRILQDLEVRDGSFEDGSYRKAYKAALKLSAGRENGFSKTFFGSILSEESPCTVPLHQRRGPRKVMPAWFYRLCAKSNLGLALRKSGRFLIRVAAKKGDKRAQLKRAAMWFTFPQTIEKSWKWAQRSLAQGHDPAYFILANILKSRGASPEILLDYYKKAAEKNYHPAQYGMGVCYERGLWELEVDKSKALEWYKKAALNGNKKAIYKIACFHEKGWGGLPVNLEQALYYYELDVKKWDMSKGRHHKKSLCKLGLYYQEGWGGLEVDMEKAIALYKRAVHFDSMKKWKSKKAKRLLKPLKRLELENNRIKWLELENNLHQPLGCAIS